MAEIGAAATEKLANVLNLKVGVIALANVANDLFRQGLVLAVALLLDIGKLKHVAKRIEERVDSLATNSCDVYMLSLTDPRGRKVSLRS